MLTLILTAVVLFHLAWYALSYYQTHKPLPNETVVRTFQQAHDDILKLKNEKDQFEECYIDANGFKLHLDILPKGQGMATVVFVPGTSVYAQVYMDFLRSMFEAGFNVVAFDPRGHGRSSGLRGDYAIDDIVEDTLAVVAYARKRFGGKVVVAGSSQGGIVAFYAAAKDDSLAAAVCHNLADLNGRQNQVLSKIRVPYRLTPAARALMRIYQGFAIPISLYLNLKIEYFENGESVADYIYKDPLCITWITFRVLNSLLKTPLTKPVERITTPVMLIHSDKDHIFPQTYVENIYNKLTCPKKYLLIKDRSHLLMTNHVQEVAPAIIQWLKKITDKPDEICSKHTSRHHTHPSTHAR